MITRIFTRTILMEKLQDELSHISIYDSMYQDVDKTVINLTEEPSLAIDEEIVQIVNFHVPTAITYKVQSLVHSAFINLPIEKIDFTNHLKKNIVLAKSTYKHPNGRPDRAQYKLGSEDIARIRWEFIDATGGLYMDRKVFLAYYQDNGILGDEFLIEHEVIDFSIPNQLEKSIKERVIARDSIVGEIKAVASGALTVALSKTMEEVVLMIKPFWDSTKLDRDNFIELATHDWRDNISQLTSNEYSWLDIPVDVDGTTCKQYMLFRLGY